MDIGICFGNNQDNFQLYRLTRRENTTKSFKGATFLNHTVCVHTVTVFQKSDAKIQITITMAHLIRISYPLSSFNYRLSVTNFANFNKIHHMVSEQQLFKQVAQLSQRDRAAGWVSYGQKWKTGTGRQYLRTI